MSKHPRRLVRLFSSVALAALCAAGCHSKSKSQPARLADAQSDARALAQRLCAALHTLPAERKAQCCGAKPQQPLLEECVGALTRSLAAHSLELDSDAVTACAADMQQTLNGCDWVTPSQQLTPATCQSLFRGRLGIGAACRSSLECEGRLHCEGSTPTQAGHCAEPAPIGAGCGSHVDALASYVLVRELERSHPFCANFCSLATHKCEPSPVEGSSCVASVNCGPEQSCVRGTCSRARGALDAPCAGSSCEPGLRCAAGRCRPFARAGERCANDFECANGGCVPGPSGDGTCGAKCSISLAALKADPGHAMRLPLRPRD